MRGSRADSLLRAVLAVQGDGPEEGLSPALVAYARKLCEARRLDENAECCPERARRRAHTLCEALPERPWEVLARLVFDSWAQLAPQARNLGSERLMRYENASTAIDVQVGREPASENYALAVAVEDCGEGCEAHLVLESGARALPLALDAHGTGSVRLPGGEGEVVVVVSDEDGELLRTPPVPFA